MAKESKKGAEEESGEFADFMADISEEIAQRVESLDTKPKAPDVKPKLEVKPKVVTEERKKTPAPMDAGVIADWPNIADRMIEEMR